jgi:hypothetical protein
MEGSLSSGRGREWYPKAAEWEFQNSMLGAKARITAQYSANSNQVQSLGIRK